MVCLPSVRFPCDELYVQRCKVKRNLSCAEADISGLRDYRNSVGSARAVSLKYSSLQSDELQSETDGI